MKRKSLKSTKIGYKMTRKVEKYEKLIKSYDKIGKNQVKMVQSLKINYPKSSKIDQKLHENVEK